MRVKISLGSTLSLVVLAAMAACNTGCAIFEATGADIAYAADLGNGDCVRLVQRSHLDSLRRGEEHNYAELLIQVADQNEITFSAEVGRVTGTFAAPPRFDLGSLAGWTDQSGQRIWIVDTEKKSVVATLDRHTQAVTGIDQPPPEWARSQRGVQLARR